ncbi:hypothetical protein G6O67_006992 [Ophiocordyceps sinensis]|uniref:Aminoglycoside phosphotransferase domain-containing protein n=2 Tax=Ophiocordyceps sinensis TaxID=72228 RepID=A0A8H4LSR1_9HYPO|nr:Protein kinase-like domain protein [Ophiocordyceps sinensis CO18]KAF4504993.1 hypothetical protein G6O67_006992 [Ophiocordyceps sinensis]
MDRTPSLAIPYDGVTYTQGSDRYQDWEKSLTDIHLRALENLVTNLMGLGGPATLVQQRSGSYNRVMRFEFQDSAGGDVALKFPKPGHSDAALAVEKVQNEAAWMEFLRENTTIPVPYVYSHGTEMHHLTPLKLPYILMEWVPGDGLREFLANKPSDELRSTVYRQLASFHLQLWRLPLPFQGIASCTRDGETGEWRSRRPLTMDMHQLVLGIHQYPRDWPTEKFESLGEYFAFLKRQQWVQLWTLRNINAPPEQAESSAHHLRLDDPKEIARLRYEARYRFQQLLDSTHDQKRDDSFRVFNPDFDTRNMTVDPQTAQITGVFDLEFSNSMPAQFCCDAPLSLFRVLPGASLDNGFFAWFLHEYESVLEQFLVAMEHEEEKAGMSSETALSALMRESWDTKRIWISYALNNMDYLDAVYWAVLHRETYPDGVAPELPPEVKVEMEEYVAHTIKQLAEYDKAWSDYFRHVVV